MSLAAQYQEPSNRDSGLHNSASDQAHSNQTAGHQTNNSIEVDSQGDADSGYCDSGLTSAFSASLASSVLDYKYQNGRRYHAFREGAYVLPNDDREQDRMDLHHHVFRLTLDGQLFQSPLTKAPRRVLDVGTGTGIWAVEFADEFASSEVIGIDLSPIQTTWVPPNCKFYVDDAESDWSYRPDEAFDFIHIRGLGGSIADWPHFYSQIYKHMTPGGWCEIQEYQAWIHSDDDTMTQYAQATKQWLVLLDEASMKFGKRLNVAQRQKQWMIDAGFVDVQENIYKVPIGNWPKDKKLKELGLYQREQMVECVESFTLALLTRFMGWSIRETEVLMAQVREDFRNPKCHLYTVFHYVYGRKPAGNT